jgi:hypothetical protein
VQFNIGQIGVSLGDMNDGKDWATVMSTNGQNSINSPDGAAAVGTGTYTANFANSVVPATATLSNTAAGYGPLILGGQFTFAAVAGVETDYVLFAYLNPAGTSAIPAKTLVITGVKIYSYVSVVAVATTATVFQWAIGVGTTAITLATADSVTTGTRAARRLGLGMQSWIVGAAVGTLGQTVDTRLSAPLIVEAGTYCQILLKIPLGTATATQFFRGIVNVNGYFE